MFELLCTANVVLAEPFSPLEDVTVCFVVLVGHLAAELLGLPDNQVVVYLHGLHLQHDCSQPVGQPL